MAVRLKRLGIKGFRSIRELTGFEPSPINLLIGVNGAGKSNFVSFFRLLSWMMNGHLQDHVRTLGSANAILFDGAAQTREVEAEIVLETEKGSNEYAFRLFFVAPDTLAFAEERYRFRPQHVQEADWTQLGGSHLESKLVEQAEMGRPTPRAIRGLLKQCVVYQFHNTSPTARIRQFWSIQDNRWLKEDAANLAPFLLRLREEEQPYYHRILETLRAVIPFFSDFELEPTKNGDLLLQWRERGTDAVFGAHQASDGMLRTMALITLLSQPEQGLPGLVVLDEPELGLHPYAISVVAGLVRSAAVYNQLVIATQSTAFLNQFAPEDVVVVERRGRESDFRRLNGAELQEWLKEYSVAELWEKNVIGGTPG